MKNTSAPRPAPTAGAPRRAGAFSLVVTLIIISMLAVVAIGFLSSMSNERVTADAYGNKTRAEQAAQAGADSAMAILRQAFKDFPDSATVWETYSKNIDGSATIDPSKNKLVGLNNEGTSLYVRAFPVANNSNLPDASADNRPDHASNPGDNPTSTTNTDGSDSRKVFVLPLVSGASYKTVNQFSDWTDANAKPSYSADAKTFVDLNVRRYKGDTQGWLGSPPSTAAAAATLPPRTVRVPWVNITQADSTANPAPVVARYAFWVEDESFRANVNYAGDSTPGGAARNRPDNTGGSMASVGLDTRVVDLFYPFRLLSDASLAASLAKSMSDTRNLYPGGLFSEALAFSHTPGLTADLADKFRFLTTTTSSGLNISRHGTQRVNLNELMYPKPDATGSPVVYSAQDQIDAIVHTIQFHAPNFGQRFYRNVPDAKAATAVSSDTLNALTVPGSTSDPNHQLMYLYKIATNIKDYIDDDSTPTWVDGVRNPDTNKYTGVVHQGSYLSPSTPPAIIYPYHNPEGGNVVWAQGKDAAPYMDECAVSYRGTIDTTGNYELDIDYHIEVWNPTTRDVSASDLGGNPKIRIVNQTPWMAANDSNGLLVPLPENVDGESPSDITGKRDFNFAIPPGTVFRAGRATVLTTDKLFASRAIVSGDALNSVVFCPKGASDPSTRVYKGKMPTGKTRVFWYGSRGTQHTSDYETEVIFLSDTGYIDTAPGPLPIYSGNANSPIYFSKTDQIKYKSYGGSLRGNGGNSTSPSGPEPSVLGDPRSNNEQMVTDPDYTSGSSVNQPRYYNFSSGSNGTLGYPNSDFSQPDNNTNLFTAWPDYYKFPAASAPVMDASKALMFVANSRLTSIGQLGDVYDPARWVGTGVTAARGGGRTLRIGQHDDLWDGDFRSASRSWAAWRLADFFCVNDTMTQPGLININGVARDNGAALRAALTGFTFLNNAPSGQGAPNIEKKPLPVDVGATQGLDTLVSQIKRRLAPAAGTVTTGTVGAVGDPNNPDLAPYNTGQGPFFERGEVSELPAFGRTNIAATTPSATYTGADLVSGVATNTTFDRGREEVFRRMAEVVTTRGNVYTVYAMGQAFSPKGAISATQMLKVTFRLTPKADNDATGGSATTSAPDFHPGTVVNSNGSVYPVKVTGDLTKRFAKPNHYDIEILSASKGGG